MDQVHVVRDSGVASAPRHARAAGRRPSLCPRPHDHEGLTVVAHRISRALERGEPILGIIIARIASASSSRSLDDLPAAAHDGEEPRGHIPPTHHAPSGVIELLVECWCYDGRKSFVDSPRHGQLETKLGEVVLAIATAAEASLAEAKRREEEERRCEEARRQRREEEAERQREIEKGKHLERQAARWSKAKMIDEYVAEVRQALAAGELESTAEVVRWLEWSAVFARKLCPIRSRSFNPTHSQPDREP